MIVEAAPAAAKNSVSFSADIVRHAETWLEEGAASGEYADWNARIALMPDESAILQRGTTGIVFRAVEDRVTGAGTIGPRREVGQTQAQFHGEPSRDLPGILREALVCAVRDIVDAV